eukprot:scaffold820_cov376-Prasinococcus_capsulatus_cf.AAC.23
MPPPPELRSQRDAGPPNKRSGRRPQVLHLSPPGTAASVVPRGLRVCPGGPMGRHACELTAKHHLDLSRGPRPAPVGAAPAMRQPLRATVRWPRPLAQAD